MTIHKLTAKNQTAGHVIHHAATRTPAKWIMSRTRIPMPTLTGMTLVAGALFAAAAPPAAAAVITESFTAAIITLPVPFTQTVLLNTFDLALGTLTGVTLSLTNNTIATIDVFNLNPGARPFNHATASIPVSLTGPDGTVVNVAAAALLPTGLALPGLNIFPGFPAANTGSQAVPAANFAAYETLSGAAKAFTAASTDGTYGGTSSSLVFFGGAAVSGGIATVTYTYTPTAVPVIIPHGDVAEPRAVALFGLGLLGIAAIRRRF
jgi:hypothetical protein